MGQPLGNSGTTCFTIKFEKLQSNLLIQSFVSDLFIIKIRIIQYNNNDNLEYFFVNGNNGTVFQFNLTFLLIILFVYCITIW